MTQTILVGPVINTSVVDAVWVSNCKTEETALTTLGETCKLVNGHMNVLTTSKLVSCLQTLAQHSINMTMKHIILRLLLHLSDNNTLIVLEFKQKILTLSHSHKYTKNP